MTKHMPVNDIGEVVATTMGPNCSKVINILSGLYFVERELKTMGLSTASSLIEGASISLREELKKLSA